MKPNVLRYLISAAVGLGLAFVIMLTQNIFGQEKASDVYRILSDSFFVSGVLLTGAGLLVFVSNNGIFDMLSYGITTFFVARKKDVKDRKYKDYYEYKQSKSERKRSFAYLLIVGLALLAIAALCLIGYSNSLEIV